MKIAVAGGGLAGLSAALALARVGCTVELLERAPSLSEAGAGVQLSPNATRVLARLGALEAIEASAVRVSHVRIRRAGDGVEIARVPLGQQAEHRYGAPFLVAHRADVQAALLAAVATQPGCALKTGTWVTGFAARHGSVEVDLSVDGGSCRDVFDGLVGADGLWSAVRAGLVPDPGDAPRFSGRWAWRSLVSAADVPPDLRMSASQLWLGSHAHLVHYPIRGGAVINVVAIVDGGTGGEAAIEGWSTAGDPDRLQNRFRSWSPVARTLIRAASGWTVWPLFQRPPLVCWSQGPVTLLGDAAHPMLPFLAQGAAQAIEDGWALGEAADTSVGFAEAALAYDRRRRPTASRVQRESSRQATVYHLAGPLAVVRDAAMRLLGPERMLARYDWLYGVPP